MCPATDDKTKENINDPADIRIYSFYGRNCGENMIRKIFLLVYVYVNVSLALCLHFAREEVEMFLSFILNL